MGKILGIIGGAGVAATNKLNVLIEERFTKNGAYRDAHHPQVIIFQATQTSSRNIFLKSKGESFVPTYIDVGKKLKRFGATVICMTSSAAHHEIGTLQKEIGLPFIDMVMETVLQIKKGKAIKIGMLVSDRCIKSKVYEKYFKKNCPEKEIVYPQKCWQEKVTLGINTVKSDGRQNAWLIFREVCNHLVNDLGVELIVVGCTDISVCFIKDYFKGIPVIESLDVLSEKIYDEFYIEIPGNKLARKFYDNLSSTIKIPEETKNKSKDSSKLDAKFIQEYSGNNKALLDIGSGTGLILNKICSYFYKIVAVERCLGLSKFIIPETNLEVLNQDILELDIDKQFDVVTIFGVMNYFNKKESQAVYNKIFPLVKEEGTLIVKHQMGVNETVNVNCYSEELQRHYYSQYRTVKEEIKMLSKCGFHDVSVVDIYPKEYNRWSNTHYYALVCKKISSKDG